ncbi:MAG: hypothetical protein AABY34_01960 [Pseudomonadota bacterium]
MKLENIYHQKSVIFITTHSSAGVEVDFIMEKKPNIYPFEVTYSVTDPKSHLIHNRLNVNQANTVIIG